MIHDIFYFIISNKYKQRTMDISENINSINIHSTLGRYTGIIQIIIKKWDIKYQPNFFFNGIEGEGYVSMLKLLGEIFDLSAHSMEKRTLRRVTEDIKYRIDRNGDSKSDKTVAN